MSMKHLNAASRRKTLIQFSIWFIAVVIVVASMTYAYSRVDVVENQALRSQVKVVEQSEASRLKHDKALNALLDAMKKFQKTTGENLEAAEKYETNLSSKLVNDNTALSDALTEFEKLEDSQRIDTAITQISKSAKRTLGLLLKITNKYYEELDTRDATIKTQIVELKSLQAKLEGKEAQITNLNIELENCRN